MIKVPQNIVEAFELSDEETAFNKKDFKFIGGLKLFGGI